MDIHSNEVKAINNSGGNAYPHLVPFLLKSSVCNKRSRLARESERERGVERGETARERRRKRDKKDEYETQGKGKEEEKKDGQGIGRE